jgi:hypothetical protein
VQQKKVFYDGTSLLQREREGLHGGSGHINNNVTTFIFRESWNIQDSLSGGSKILLIWRRKMAGLAEISPEGAGKSEICGG